MADGLELVHELGMGQELGDGAERKATEVLVETGDDERAAVGQLERAAGTIAGSRNCTSSIPTTSNPFARATSSATEEIGTARIRAPAWLTMSAAS